MLSQYTGRGIITSILNITVICSNIKKMLYTKLALYKGKYCDTNIFCVGEGIEEIPGSSLFL